MSRSGYIDDFDYDTWSLIRWRGAVASAIRGRRGQEFLKEMLSALDAMPRKELIAKELIEEFWISCSHWVMHLGEDGVCALGCVGKARGATMDSIDPEDREEVAELFKIAPAMASEIMFENDEGTHLINEKASARWFRVRAWVVRNIGQ